MSKHRIHQSPKWRKVRDQVLAISDICWLCGRPGAETVDHIVEISNGGAPYDLTNLAPAHGPKQPWGCPGNYGRSGRKKGPLRPPPTSRAW